jgi:3-oxo-5-alpha-steroid 4-dehydrogenase 1
MATLAALDVTIYRALMSEQTFFNILLVGWFVLAVAIFVALFYVVAPYGRHARSSWGPTIGDRLGWIVMEASAPLVFAIFFAVGTNSNTIAALAFFVLWEAHYIHRAFVYPSSRHTGVSRMSVVVVGLGLLFNTANAYLNGRYLFTFSGGYPNKWLLTPQFISGLGLFLAGFVINRRSDHVLRYLRKPGESGYKIPNGGLYRWISCPNYFGEIITWIGWAVATWSPPGLAFAVWTTANLMPRARAHHIWYREHFADYPPERKVLVPGVW